MKTFLTIFILLVFSLANYEISGQNKSSSTFKDATMILDHKTNSPKDIRFNEGNYISLNSFFDEYRNAFNLSNDNEFRSFRVLTDKLGQTHDRYKQYYKGIELAEVQFILHVKNGIVFHANGKLIHDLDLDVTPSLSEEDALQYALSHINAESYMWESKKNEAYLKREQNDPDATMYPKGVLMLSAKNFDLQKENFHLVYRFDIFSEKPMDRYYIDVDAKTGEIINKISRIQSGDVPGQGTSVYNGTVSLTVADTAITDIGPGRWHVNSWNAYQGGLSWWDADSSLGNQGGYDNGWFEGLITDNISLSGSNLMLEFYHRYKVEEPDGATPPYDGWDGMNVWISTDDGINWLVLENPVPAYSNSSLYSFGDHHGLGPNIPGWTGELSTWTNVSIDLSAYTGQVVRIGFAFASDGAISTNDGGPDLFGWQIDNIIVSNSSATLYSNDGDVNGITNTNLLQEASFIEGNYRLRQYGRGGGIATYDAMHGVSRALSVDFVDADSSFDTPNSHAGVSLHWGLENTYDYYFAKHGRNSYDDNGGKLVAYAHWDNNWFNAQWLGSWMRFGDGTSNNIPLVSIDIVSHELTHGVTQFTAGLIYQMEYGALNESFSDIFGTAVEFYTLGSGGNWFMGEGGARLRSMSDPNSFGDPDTYFGNFWASLTGGDNGGVHTNSSVQNYWFYLLSEGGSGVNDNAYAYSVTGLGIDEAAQIAYRNLSTYLTPTSEYFDARLGSMYAAIDLYGDNSQQYQSVVEAWNAVGVYIPFIEPTVNVSPEAPVFLAEVSSIAATVNLTVTNFGISALTIDNIQVTDTHFEITSSPSLPIELTNLLDSFTMSIAFTPTDTGIVNASLEIASNDPVNPVKSVTLIGNGYRVNPAYTEIFYASSDSVDNGNIYSVDKNTGFGALLGPSLFNNVISLTVDPVTNLIYGLSVGVNESSLVRVNATGGDSYKLFSFSFDNLSAIAFDNLGDLYLAFQPGNIYKVNLSSGSLQFIAFANIQIQAMAFDPVTNELWASVRQNSGVGRDRLYKIDLDNGSSTLIGSTGLNEMTNDIAFDENNELYGIVGGLSTGKLIKINTTDASGIVIGEIGFDNIAGLAYAINGDVNSVTPDGDENVIPEEFALSQNYPNPFNPSTTIEFSVPVNSNVTLTIFNLLGQAVTTLANEELSTGKYSVVWNGEDQSGLKVSSGVYLYKMQANGTNGREFQETRKMVLLK